MKNKLLSIFTSTQLIDELKSVGSVKHLAEKHNTSLATAYKAFKLIGYDCYERARNVNEFLTKELLEQEYKELQSCRKIAEKFNISHETVRFWIHKYDLEYNEPVKYDVDHNFFATDTIESLYLAGFIAADGCIRQKNEHYMLQIALSSKDKTFLEMIRDLLKSASPISDHLVKNSKRDPKWNDIWKSEMKITSKQIFDDLARFNITPRKTKTLTFPEWLIDHPLVNHFIRGYFDGDGSFHTPKLSNRDGHNRTVSQVFFGLRGTQEFLRVVRDIFEHHCELKHREKDIRISSGHGTLEYGGNGVVAKIAQFLYKDATIWLPRKKAIIEHLL